MIVRGWDSVVVPVSKSILHVCVSGRYLYFASKLFRLFLSHSPDIH